MTTGRLLLAASILTLALAGCSNAKEKLGLTKVAPDEFAVITRAPLAMPPDSSLPPPRPGAARPQEQSPVDTARQSLFGEDSAESGQMSAGETALLQNSGAAQTSASIRYTVDREAAEVDDSNRAVVDKLMDWGGAGAPSTSVVDAKKEAERIKQNQAEGKPVTEGQTPTVEQ